MDYANKQWHHFLFHTHINSIKTRLQVQNKAIAHLNPHQHYDHALDAFLKIFKTEGIKGLYAGLGAGLFGTVASSFSYFYFYSTLRTRYIASRPAGAEITTAMELLLGAAAGAMSQLFTLPIAVVTTRQQTSTRAEKKSFIDTLKGILHDEGPKGLWKGLKASLVLCVNPAITYGMFERVKAIWLKRRLAALGGRGKGVEVRLSSLEVFCIGALSKTLATIVTYPYIMAKVRMQWRPPRSAEGLSAKQQAALRYTGSLDVLRKVYASDGILGWYKGMQTQITKAVLCQAILFVGKEQFTTWTLLVLQAFAKYQAEHAAEAVVEAAAA
ncbi:ADP/ATP carrier protein [Chytridiales sp. JEL 0842]|nr:ADP/ATP carrier protein [Chytridiales sp. JEL 0842]